MHGSELRPIPFPFREESVPGAFGGAEGRDGGAIEKGAGTFGVRVKIGLIEKELWIMKIKVIGILSAIVGLIGLLVFSPVITFAFAWFGGWILKQCVGSACHDRQVF